MNVSGEQPFFKASVSSIFQADLAIPQVQQQYSRTAEIESLG